MKGRGASVITVASWLLSGGAFVLLAVAEASGIENNLFHYQDAAVGLVFPALGWLLLQRAGSHPVGWILVVAGLSGAVGAFAEEYVTVGLEVSGFLPALRPIAWLGSWTWAFFFALLPALLLLFPDGHPPTPRWRPAMWLAGAPVVLLPVLLAVATWPASLETLASSADPNFPPALEALFAGAAVVFVIALLVALGSLAVKWRTSSGIARQQLKVFFICASAGVIALGFSQLETSFQDVFGVTAFLLVPAGMVAAILRYRLYDIDRIVSRTVSYAVVSAVLVAMFLALVFAFQLVLPGDGDLATAASTLAVAATFNPLRRRVQAFIDRYFNRSRYDAVATLESFSLTVRSEGELPEVRELLIAVTAETVEPAFLGLWLRESSGAVP
ncbi:MAG TPA: hypothetical protein VHL52_06925 [Acidimicrobiia bacterium]|nr:hypothetical protein [Acidimicrobiia bacterium]